jgi:hypothetical protein
MIGPFCGGNRRKPSAHGHRSAGRPKLESALDGLHLPAGVGRNQALDVFRLVLSGPPHVSLGNVSAIVTGSSRA